MPETPTQSPRLLTLDPCCAPPPPGWAVALAPTLGDNFSQDAMRVQMRRGPGALLMTAVAPGARAAVGAAAFEAVSTLLYRRICDSLAEQPGLTPVRFWNYIPAIGEDLDSGLDRYRAFNKGRKAALAAWMGECHFERRLPTATGVGHDGDDLVVYCLACAAPGQPLENPRQRPAYRYSARYGPASPSFARATRVALGSCGRETLLVGGTASVQGEDTAHEGDLEAQFEETAANLRALLAAAAPGRSEGGGRELEQFTSVRAYYRHATDAEYVQARSLELFPGAQVIELMRADICRPELLVEIEGQAELAAPAPTGSGARAGDGGGACDD